MKSGVWYSHKPIRHLAVELDSRFEHLVEDGRYWADLLGTYHGPWGRRHI